jgi:hypothetical protein
LDFFAALTPGDTFRWMLEAYHGKNSAAAGDTPQPLALGWRLR